ncbi:penicillin-binding protein 1A [Parvibaculum indicum]|uniref:transglycosylase domain-containing protein n=1 Tax=Parvibaculum indicum TaxID=562969 RepID=UPI00142222E1|nr:PBP1A family penicillin-binding protein [Parvibaculum indicum]NIJ42456.1 penicillin-binding protein 1A [Parvibaculum indicum]
MSDNWDDPEYPPSAERLPSPPENDPAPSGPRHGPTARLLAILAAGLDWFRAIEMPRGREWIAPIASFVFTFFFILAALLVFDTLPKIDGRLAAGPHSPGLAVTVLDTNGKEIGSRGGRAAKDVPLGELPPYLVNAFIATEDRRFYEHGAVELRSILRAALANLSAGGFVQGGSTITQQLAKNLYLDNARTLWRKAQEALISVWLERRLTKDEILELYLNRIYMGGGTYGVEAASQYYFGKSAREVTLAEAAILAGLPKAPSRFAPSTNLKAARTRAGHVLDAMVANGNITEAEAREARTNPAEMAVRDAPDSENYFLDWVYDRVGRLLPEARGRFIVRTTLDRKKQAAAAAAIAGALKANGEKLNISQGAMIALAPDGSILAMVGGKSYGDSQFNRAVQARRQPGSAFKPFVYLAALEDGMKPWSGFYDKRLDYNGWTPQNAGGKSWGQVTMTTALAHSINRVAVQVGDKVGVERVREAAKELGIASPIPHNLSITLGSSGVSLMELTGAYAAFPAEGRLIAPYAIRQITASNGSILYTHATGTARATSKRSARYMNAMLRRVMTTGTGKGARLDDRLAAGKTGTSQDYRDAWFIGYTGNEIAGVWFGNDDNAPMKRVYGGTVAARAWKSYMQASLRGTPPAPIPGVSDTDWVNPDDERKHEPEDRLTGFFAGLADIFSRTPRQDPNRRWGSGFRRGGEMVGSGY